MAEERLGAKLPEKVLEIESLKLKLKDIEEVGLLNNNNSKTMTQ